MAYFTCESAVPLTHIESGMLISSGGFQHINRKLDYYVLLWDGKEPYISPVKISSMK